MKDCEHYEKCKDTLVSFNDIKKEIADIKKNDTSQTASLKSLHKRMDEDAIVRKKTQDIVLLQGANLEHHMEWEEAEAITKEKRRKIQDDKDAFRFKVYFSLVGAVSSILVGLFSWVLLNVSDNKTNSKVLAKSVKDNAESMSSYTKSQQKLNEKVTELIIEFKTTKKERLYEHTKSNTSSNH